MKRTMTLSAAVMIGLLGWASAAQAQVFIRVPFVRVWVGDGVSVRAPFVNVNVPPRVYYTPAVVVEKPLPPASEPIPAPRPPINDANAPPQPVQPAQVMTIDAFAKNFQAKAGSYEVTLLNPTTKQPTAVRFSLPEGTPRRVQVTRDSVEFIYGLRQWVRIEFDKDGAIVTAR